MNRRNLAAAPGEAVPNREPKRPSCHKSGVAANTQTIEPRILLRRNFSTDTCALRPVLLSDGFASCGNRLGGSADI
jgi:hypothetical protein